MVAASTLAAWLRANKITDRVRVSKRCMRAVVRKCRRGCLRAALTPCSRATARVVADRAVTIIGLPCFFTYIISTRDKLLESNKNKPPNEQESMGLLTTDCLQSCVPHWNEQWKLFCKMVFKHVCMRMSLCMCHAGCLRPCKLPCKRVPRNQLRRHMRTQMRVGVSIVYSILASVDECMRVCKDMVPNWVKTRLKHICKLAEKQGQAVVPAKTPLEEFIEERKALTNRYNVLNSCKF